MCMLSIAIYDAVSELTQFPLSLRACVPADDVSLQMSAKTPVIYLRLPRAVHVLAAGLMREGLELAEEKTIALASSFSVAVEVATCLRPIAAGLATQCSN